MVGPNYIFSHTCLIYIREIYTTTLWSDKIMRTILIPDLVKIICKVLDHHFHHDFIIIEIAMTSYVVNFTCKPILSNGMYYHDFVTNLTSHDLVMEFMQNLFIHNLYISHINIVHWKHVWDMNLLEDAKYV
jgi:hypothetical protein